MNQPNQEYLAHLRQLAEECRSIELVPAEEPAASPEVALQLAALAASIERLEDEMREMREAQNAAADLTYALERRVSNLEQSSPSPQAWRDLIHGIRKIREVVAAQALEKKRLVPQSDERP